MSTLWWFSFCLFHIVLVFCSNLGFSFTFVTAFKALKGTLHCLSALTMCSDLYLLRVTALLWCKAPTINETKIWNAIGNTPIINETNKTKTLMRRRIIKLPIWLLIRTTLSTVDYDVWLQAFSFGDWFCLVHNLCTY